jgi:hypothetical protein
VNIACEQTSKNENHLSKTPCRGIWAPKTQIQGDASMGNIFVLVVLFVALKQISERIQREFDFQLANALVLHESMSRIDVNTEDSTRP